MSEQHDEVSLMSMRLLPDSPVSDQAEAVVLLRLDENQRSVGRSSWSGNPRVLSVCDGLY